MGLGGITEEQLEQLGQLVDKADNYLALVTPSSAMQIEALKQGLTEIRLGLHDLYLTFADDDPWAEERS